MNQFVFLIHRTEECYGDDAESKLLAGIHGHNLCLDYFGLHRKKRKLMDECPWRSWYLFVIQIVYSSSHVIGSSTCVENGLPLTQLGM
jgi:hypothetical protein